MVKYAMFSAPGHGHVNPTLAIAQELIARGEQVIYYLPEQWRPMVEATGATFRLFEFGFPRSGPPMLEPGKKADMHLMIGRMMQMMVDASKRALPRLLEELRTEQVDCILYDRMFFPARLLSLALDLPAVLLSPSYIPNERALIEQFVPRDKSQSFMAIFASLNEDLARLCDANHLPHYDTQTLSQPTDLNIFFLPRTFHPGGGDTFDERFVFVGPSLQTQRYSSDDFPLERLNRRPLLYISLGTAFNKQVEFYKQCFNAFGQSEWQVVLAHGQQIDPAELKDVPANFIVAPHVPQLEVLTRTNVFVSHGGMNSTMESLNAGVPLVVVPQMVEQEVTARRVRELGLGLALKTEELSAEQLRGAVEQVAHDSGFRERVKEMQQQIREAGGYQRATDAIMNYAHARVHA
jgi:MGT family glycosyltransferase